MPTISTPAYHKILLQSCRFRLALICLLLALNSCKKSNVSQNEPEVLPEITSIEIVPLSPAKAKFKASLSGTGFKVLDHGFTYSSNVSFDAADTKMISLGATSSAGEFTVTVDDLSLGITAGGQKLYVKAYFTTVKGTVYGSTMQATMLEASTWQVLPAYGKAGDKVTLSGQYFSTESKEIKVFFDQIEAKILLASDQSLEVEVPSGLLQKHGEMAKIYVSVDGRKSEATASFTVYANIKDFSPKSGPYGTLITFSGENLPADGPSDNLINIFFDGKESKLTTARGSSTIEVPLGTSIQNKIKVRIKDSEITLPGEFTLSPPEIEAVTPLEVYPGGTFMIIGKNFPTSLLRLSYEVRIGQYQAIAKPDYKGHLVTVPEMPAGEYPLSIFVDPLRLVLPQRLTVTNSPFSFSPSSGMISTLITIKGVFDPNMKDAYSVYFENMKAYPYQISDTELTVSVPYFQFGQELKLTLDVYGKKISIPGTFTLLYPSIASFSPTSGKPGTVVTISGDNFDVTGGAYVRIGSKFADAEKINKNTVKFTVPSGTPPGDFTLELTLDALGTETSQTFKVL